MLTRPYSYIFFCEAVRPELKAKYPENSVIELAKIQGEMWKELPQEEVRMWASTSNGWRAQLAREWQTAEGPRRGPSPQTRDSAQAIAAAIAVTIVPSRMHYSGPGPGVRSTCRS